MIVLFEVFWPCDCAPRRFSGMNNANGFNCCLLPAYRTCICYCYREQQRKKNLSIVHTPTVRKYDLFRTRNQLSSLYELILISSTASCKFNVLMPNFAPPRMAVFSVCTAPGKLAMQTLVIYVMCNLHGFASEDFLICVMKCQRTFGRNK